jgi:hypothetical protein
MGVRYWFLVAAYSKPIAGPMLKPSLDGGRMYVHKIKLALSFSHTKKLVWYLFTGHTADKATTLEKLWSLQPCGTLLWPMYWQISVHVIGAISLI